MNKKRKTLIDACSRYIELRITRITTSIGDLEGALKLETKCTAGDKYETGRAMLHLEFEKLSHQLEQYKRLEKTLAMVHPVSKQQSVSFGSVVKTTKANYFLAIPAGEIEVEGEVYFAIGTGSPIAQALLSKTVGETFRFNGRSGEITELL